MSRLLRRHFKAVFMTDPPMYTKPSSSHSALPRIELNEDIRTDTLYRWLRDRIPSRRAASGGPVAQPAVEKPARACTHMPGMDSAAPAGASG